jgi:hypothetical protein
VIKRSLIALALAAALPMSAQATEEGLSFTFVEADYVSTDVQDVDLNGFAVRGNVAFHENWYVAGSLSRSSKGDLDWGYSEPVDLDFEQGTLGVGFHTALGEHVQFLAEAAYVNYGFELSAGTLGISNERYNGYRGTAGIRALLGPKFELDGRVHYTSVDEIDDGIGAEVNGVFHINKTWGIAAGYEQHDMDGGDLQQWKLGVRASF